MGYIAHHAIIVTSWDTDAVAEAYRAAQDYKLTLTPITASTHNGYQSFMVVPDGSKEGWGGSIAGDLGRDLFVQYLSSALLDWVEVLYGSDNVHAVITRSCQS